MKTQSQLLCEALDAAGIPCTKHVLTEEQTKRWEEGSKEFQVWWDTIHPEYCACGKKIEKHDCGINGIDVCEKCFHEATKHMVFK